jgi:chemotaxis protein histidine kinase CheA
MATKKGGSGSGGDSKQGLIIALVCFVLLSIGLGVFAYYGNTDKETLITNEKKAKTELEAMKKTRDWYQYLALQEREFLGHLDAAKANDLSQLRDRSQSSGEADKADWDKLFATLREDLVKEKDKDKTAEYYKDKVAKLDQAWKATKDLLAKTQNAKAKADENIKKMTEDHSQERAQWEADLNKAKATALKERQEQESRFEKMLAEFGDLNKKLGDLSKKAENDKEGDEKTIKKLQLQLAQLEQALKKAQEAIKPPDLFKFDTPKGTIVKLDPKGEVAYIDIGSADNLRTSQNVTFSIFPAGAGGKTSGDRKGALEVVDVLGPHLSRAKIIEVTDPNRDPIVTGDFLINPAWSPTNRTHVAIAGLIDLTGEGRDNIDEFMKNLKREGIVIDAYLDLSDLSVKGDGITLKTDYLILGEAPLDKVGASTNINDPRFQRKKDIAEAIEKMRLEANKLGVAVVPLRRFAVQTGYRLPKGVGLGGGPGYDYIRPGETLSTPEKETPKKSDKKKEEKKEKDDEEKDKDK